MTPVPYADTASSDVKAWMGRYKDKFGQDANIQALVGYLVLTTAVIGMEKAGRDLTPDSLVAGLEKISNLPNMFGSAPISFTSSDHLATRKTFVAQIKNGRWEKLTEFCTTDQRGGSGIGSGDSPRKDPHSSDGHKWRE
jgi:branched-chain amino acid transport system substrate-binding protein